MKGKLLAVAAMSCSLASGFALAQENITSELDASLRLGLELNTEPDAELTFNNYSSRIRWRGTADAGKGLKAISYLEFGFDQDEGVSTTRHAWLGVEGDFGTVKGGKQYRAFYDAVTAPVDIAYWGSCISGFELQLACSRQSSVIKFTGPETDDLQLMASTILVADDADNDFIDGIDVAAKMKSGDKTIGAGLTMLIGNSDENGADLGTGYGIGISVTTPVDTATATLSLQFANEDYLGGVDDGFSFSGAYQKDQMYGVFGIGDSGDSTPFYFTLGYEKPVIENKAFAYFEVGAVDPDEDNVDVDLQVRAVMVFNMDLLSVGI